MYVYVKCRNNKKRQIVYDVIEHCYDILIKNLDIDLTVKFKSKLDDNANAWCQQNSHNTYQIDVDSKLGLRTLIKTMCHEMVHVKQYVKGELIDHRYWRGKEYNFRQPWEIEAYNLETILFRSFLKKRQK